MLKAASGAVYRRVKSTPNPGAFPSLPDLSGWWRQGNFTSSAGRVSQWNDSSGNARHLLQGTGLNQPVGLSFAGTKYLYSPAVTGNHASTPDSAAASITGDIDIRVKLSLRTVAANASLVSKLTGNPGRSYDFQITAASKLQFVWSPTGNAAEQITVTSTVGHGFSASVVSYARVTLDVDNGASGYDAKFWTSTDGTTWSQLGTTITGGATTSIADTTTALWVGEQVAGGNTVNADIYYAQIYSGINGTLAVNFNASDWTETTTNGATATASTTGELWTLNNTGSKLAQIVGSAQVLADGVAYFMRASYTQAQPVTRFALVKKLTWTNGTYTFDGVGANSAAIVGSTGTPKLSMNAGTPTQNENAAASLGVYHAIAMVWNGASSQFQIDTTSVATGNPGATTTGGLTIFADGQAIAANFGSGQVKELIEYNRALSQTEINAILRYLSYIGNLGLTI